MEENKVLLQMKNVSKTFPGVKALNGVHIEVEKGEVHALLGENGAGKSTLIKVLGGIYICDEGEIFIDEKIANIHDVSSSESYGISIIHQELCLAPNMTVAENILLGRELVKGPFSVVDHDESEKYVASILDKYGMDIDAGAQIKELSIAQQQMVEIAKALSKNSRIIVMDEPTSSLSDKGTKKLFKAIESLKKEGVSIIYISHRMEELFAIADKVTVLRDSEYIGTKLIKETTQAELIKMMVGRELKEMFSKPEGEVRDAILEVKNLNQGNKVRDISFALREGEILGLYGLVGSGRTETMRAILGIDRLESGKIFYRGKEVNIKNPKQAMDLGIVLVPEDRKLQGAVLGQSIRYNITLCILERFMKWFSTDSEFEKNTVQNYFNRLRIKAYSEEQKVVNLSGGNQQKVIIAKWLATNPKILILDEPTRGIDVGAKKEIYTLMNELVKSGLTIIMISSELAEVINMSTRVLTMYNGQLNGELIGDEISQENILTNVTGGSRNV